MDRKFHQHFFTVLLILALLASNGMRTFAQTPITTIATNAVTTGLTTSSYVVTSPSDASGNVDASTSYTVNYGQVQNLFVTSYSTASATYDNFVLPDTLIIRRTDAGRQLVIFYELDNIDNTGDIIDLDAEQVDNEEGLYQSGLLNAGYDNILVNTATNFANVERIDIIYSSGVVTSAPADAVFPIIERGGNDDIKVAAIKALDANGDPSEYYPTVVLVDNNGTSEWGNSGISHTSLVLRRQDATSNPLPQADLGAQNIHGSAVSFSAFGILADEIVYGYSIMSDDVDDTPITNLVDFTNATNYPTNTGSDSGLDLIAGISTAVSDGPDLISATGPGGYKSALSTWLKANVAADVTTSTDGLTVTDWQDHALADNDATTLTTAPVYRDGTASAADDINFNPTVDFLDASETGLQIADNPEMNNNGPYTTKSMNIAFRTGNDVAVKQQLFEEGGGTNGLGIFINGSRVHVSVWNKGNSGSSGAPWNTGSPVNTVSSATISTDTEYIVTLEFNGSSASTGTVTGYLNGQSFGTLSSVGLLYDHTNDIGLGDQDGGSLYDDGSTAAASFYGSIPEFIYCNEPGSASFATNQRQRIESYLALKYGITLDQTSPLNYLNSNGDVIFNTTNAASIGGYLEYNKDIAGIGRDDNSEFLQIRSQSENVNSLVEIHRSSAAGIGTDDTWLIWGNDAGALTESAVVSSPSTIKNRLERVWRVAEENSMGVTDISFDLTGLGLSTTATDFSLLVASNSSSADFSSATLTTGGTFNGNVLTFTGINLADGEYFTLATANFFCTPGNYDDGANMWLKADAGVTTASEGSNVTAWTDQTPSSNNAVNITAPVYRATTELFNFNPTIDFATGSTGLSVADATGLNSGESVSKKFSIAFRTDDDLTTKQVIYEQGGATRGLNLYIRAGSLHMSAWNQASDGTGAPWNTAGGISTISTSSITANTEYLVTFNYEGNDAITGTIEGFLNGQTLGTLSSIGRLYGHTDDIGIGDENGASRYDDASTSGAASFDGQISELTFYNASSSYTNADRRRIESSLALKYGVSLSNNDNNNGTPGETISGSLTEGDYVASDGTTIFWDYSAHEPTYVNDVAGIGRDDKACLEQKQSRSNNSDDIVTMGLGTIAATNAANVNTFDDDLDFLTWANDDGSTAFANRTTAGTPGTVAERMLRVWKAQDTGNVGDTDISFDLTGLPGYSTNAGDYQLIIANGGDNTSLDAGTTVTGGTFNGTVLTFDNVNLTDGQYFTLGVSADLCGPGGVTSSMVLWLRADTQAYNTGTTQATDGQTVATWDDQSTAANDATTDGNPPAFSNNSTDNINFLPTLTFDGANDRLSLGNFSEIKSGSSGNGDYSMFGVGVRDDATTNYVLGSEGGTTNEDLHFGYRNSTQATIAHWGNDLNVTVNAFDSPTAPYLVSSTYDGSNRDVEELRSDDFNRASESESVDLSGTKTNFVGDVGSLTNYDGRISEVLVYDRAVTNIEKLRIYSYFSIKYGITPPIDNNLDLTLNQTISGSVAEGDLVASNGTTIIWDYSNTDYATYHNHMAGIGRDDDACLNQKQSTSATDGSILTMGLGTVAADNAANGGIHDNFDFLVWGNDNVNPNQATAAADLTDLPSTVSERMRTVWRVEDTGIVGETEIQFDLTGLGYSSTASDFRLIISNSSTMASGTLTAGGTFNGSVLSFTGIDLTDGQYFTLGTALTTCGPGGVNDAALALWLRADLQVYEDVSPGTDDAENGDDALQWIDQSSPANSTSENDGAGGAAGAPVEPVFNTDEINYNPALLVTDQNTTNNSFMETTSNTVDGNMTLITVFNTAQNQGSTTDFSDAPALIGANSSGTDDYGLGMSLGQLHFNAANNSTLNARSTGTYNDGEPYIATGTRVQASSGAINLYANSESVATGTSDNTALSGPNSFAIGNHSTYTNGGQFQGDIAETIVFSKVLSGEEQSRVESYLALKYGITNSNNRDGDGTTNEIIEANDPGTADDVNEGDYVAGDGGIIWDYADQGATYYHDIAGIGRDDLSCFEQPHSKSENNDAIVDIEIESFTADDSWLVWGNDDAALEAPNNTERPATINSRVNREWRVQETGTIGDVMVTFDISAITGTPTGDNNLNLLRMLVDPDGNFSDASTILSPTSIDAINKTATFTYDFSTGDYYTLGSTEADALPITLISFTATLDNNQVLVEWATAQEINNSFYTIERSIDGRTFEAIGFKEGAGDSNEILEYAFTDNRPLNGISFYRLVQTDFNGDMSFSSVSRIQYLESQENAYTLVPNPVIKGRDFAIRHTVNFEQKVQVIVIDTSGKIKIRNSYLLKPDEQEILLSTSQLSLGIYLVKVITQDGSAATLRLIIR